MRSEDFIERVKTSKKAVLTINDIAKITGQKKEYIKVYLFRLKKRGLIQEVERGKYITKQHPFLTASNLVFPSYISFLSAYSYYQLTTQMPRVIEVVTLRSKKELVLDNYKITFMKFPSKRLFGYHKEKFMGKEIFVAEKEKAIVDSLYLPQYCPLDETYLALETELNTAKLVSYAQRMNSTVLLKRLGYLLEIKGHDIYPQVKEHLNKRYDLLNPLQKRRKKRLKMSKKWKLIINEDLENVE